MDKEKAQYIREVAITQLNTLKDLAKDDIKLSIELDVAISALSGKDTSRAPAVAQPVIDFAHNVDEYDHNVDDNYDEYDDDYEDHVEDYINDEQEELPVPDGFADREEYEAFLATQEDVMPKIEDEFGNEQTAVPDTMAGFVNGQEVGNLDGDLEKVSEILVETNTIYDEEGNVEFQQEVEEVPSIRVSFTRDDRNELTIDQVKNSVLRAPESTMMLNSFGHNFNIVDGTVDAEKVIEFFIDNTNIRSRQASQAIALSDIVKFGGRVLIPGLGLVTARAIVDRPQY